MSLYSPESEVDLPDQIYDIAEARWLFNLCAQRVSHFKRTHANCYRNQQPGNIPLEVYARAQHLEKTFIRFGELLDGLERTDSKFTQYDSHCLSLLRVWQKLVRITAATSLVSECSITDMFVDEYRTVLELCESITNCPTADPALFSASFSEGLPMPVFFTAVHCRDSLIRHRALNLLKEMPTDQSAWHLEAMCG